MFIGWLVATGYMASWKMQLSLRFRTSAWSYNAPLGVSGHIRCMAFGH